VPLGFWCRTWVGEIKGGDGGILVARYMPGCFASVIYGWSLDGRRGNTLGLVSKAASACLPSKGLGTRMYRMYCLGKEVIVRRASPVDCSSVWVSCRAYWSPLFLLTWKDSFWFCILKKKSDILSYTSLALRRSDPDTNLDIGATLLWDVCKH
jgi:hypothetical protein